MSELIRFIHPLATKAEAGAKDENIHPDEGNPTIALQSARPLLQLLSCVLKTVDSSSNRRRKVRQTNRTTQPGDLRQGMSSPSPPYTKSPQNLQLIPTSPGPHLRPLPRNHNCRHKIRIRPRPLQ